MTPEAESPAARAAAKIVEARRLKPGESGEDAGLRDSPYPPTRAGGFPKPKKVTPKKPEPSQVSKTKCETCQGAVLEKPWAKGTRRQCVGCGKWEAACICKGAPRSGATEPVLKPSGTRQAAAQLIVALEAERDKLDEIIEALRRYAV